jgi:hypothetical protein
MKSDESRPRKHSKEAEDPKRRPAKAVISTYRDFQRWMDRELAKLVARWIHAAAPCASPRSRFRPRAKKPK